MKKVQLLRDHLLQAQALNIDAGQLHTTVRKGKILSRAGTNTIYLQTPVEVLVTDFPGDVEVLAFFVIQWLNKLEPEREDSFDFECDILDQGKSDVLFTLQLQHSILPIPTETGTSLYYRADPVPDELYEGTVELFLKDDSEPDGSKKIAEWQAVVPRPVPGENPEDHTLPEPAEG
ncbi:hypothetical protein R50073_24540 [Maricurvus nonylphenolicus]|uniref:phage tail protein n=1 Tax=Maricurvus nonylphenolicus TaxID=1008307 RepID=UPI0036F2E158